MTKRWWLVEVENPDGPGVFKHCCQARTGRKARRIAAKVYGVPFRQTTAV